jgi:hypothetical protein
VTAVLPLQGSYLDPRLPVADRVADLLQRMTLPEKVGQMLQLSSTHIRPAAAVRRNPRPPPEHGAFCDERVQNSWR